MRYLLTSLLQFLFLTGFIFADGPLKFERGPYLQNPTTDSMTVMWGEKVHCKGEIAYGLSKDRLENNCDARIVNPSEKVPYNGFQQEVTITGLQPGTRYYYQVTSTPVGGGAPLVSPVSFFTTLDEQETEVVFAVIADTHPFPGSSELAARISDHKPAFILHAGDYNKPRAGLFYPYREVLSRTPVFFARGNHDAVSKHQEFVNMPGAGGDLFYSFRRGNVLLLAVDSNDKKGLLAGGTQYKWLENQLKNSSQTWKIVFQHHPVYSAWGGKKHPHLEDVRKLYEKYKVNVVFQGHIHNFDRSYPLLQDKKIGPLQGVTYITSSGACGGMEPFPKGDPHWFVAKKWRGAGFFGLVRIEGDTASIAHITLKGEEFDSLELKARK